MTACHRSSCNRRLATPPSVLAHRAAQIVPLLYGNARQTVFENERDQANRRDLCLFVEAEFEQRASVPRCNTRRAVEHEIAERIGDRAAMIKIERLNTMRMRPNHKIDAM